MKGWGNDLYIIQSTLKLIEWLDVQTVPSLAFCAILPSRRPHCTSKFALKVKSCIKHGSGYLKTHQKLISLAKPLPDLFNKKQITSPAAPARDRSEISYNIFHICVRSIPKIKLKCFLGIHELISSYPTKLLSANRLEVLKTLNFIWK